MNKILFLLFLQVLAIACFADEYKDPATNVIYTYDPTGNRAEVKQGVRYHDFDVDSDGDIGTSGSPDAKAEIIIIDRFTIDGKEYIVDKIGDYAFVQMYNIISIVIPPTVKSIGAYAFGGCFSMSDIVMAKGICSIEAYAFAGCHSLTALSLPEGLETIGSESFVCCSKLEFVSIPSSVTNIELMVFLGCDALTKVISLIENPFKVENLGLSQQGKATLYVPAGTKSKYVATPGWNQFCTIEEIQPSSITFQTLHQKSNYYDLQGRKFPCKPEHGIYIEDGKKVMK